MPRTARIILSDHPHHITQRGNRKQPVFFSDGDYRLYLSILHEEIQKHPLGIWAYCLMPNHVHFIAVPETPEALSNVFKETHRRYTRFINKREGWTGYLWQGRFASFPMKEPHALMATRYIENNPVVAGLVDKAENYRWSSARTHCGIEQSPILKSNPLVEDIKDWKNFLQEGLKPQIYIEADTIITKHLKNGDTLTNVSPIGE